MQLIITQGGGRWDGSPRLPKDEALKLGLVALRGRAPVRSTAGTSLPRWPRAELELASPQSWKALLALQEVSSVIFHWC